MPDGLMAETSSPASVEAIPSGPHSDDEKLAVRLWLRMLSCTAQIEQDVRGRLRAQFATTLPRFDVLAQLDRAPDGLTMSGLSARLMVSAGNITGLVARLADEGLVERAPHPADGRAQVVRMTPAGKQAFDRMTPAHAGWIAEIFEGLSETEQQALHQALGHLKRHLDRDGARDDRPDRTAKLAEGTR
ncbi:MAG: MarR family transcriptional regulator [Minwuia sp.]|nr:MarR family transcriptional regulator [Minwuia sp.]